jgi:hypothetical protein
MHDLDKGMYEPKSPHLIIVKSRLSAGAWAARVEAARRHQEALERICTLVEGGESLNGAIRKSVRQSRRSWVMHHWERWRREGLEALVDARLPREPLLLRACRPVIETARLADANVSPEKVLEILRSQRVEVLPSLSTIRACFRRVDGRRRYAKKKQEKARKVEELTFAGGELLLAAEQETRAVGALTDAVEALSAQAKAASKGKTPARDVELRDRRGRFTARYNRARRCKQGEEIASYLAPAEKKAEGRVPAWPRFVHERRRTVEAKLSTLTLSPLVSETKGWDALRAQQAAELAPLTGLAYMPSTLAKMTSALAISNAGPRLLEAVGSNWHRVAEERWGERGAMAALYVDNHAKEVWTSLFTQSGKVSHLSRVMPCITTTYVHTGAGTPLVASVQSGSAPLAPRLVHLVEEAEAKLGSEVRRAVVIDAEGSTFDILETFTERKRVIVTPLRPSRSPELSLSFSPGSYFRPYRDHDELRTATAILHHKSSGRSLTVGALLVRRRHRDSDTVLLTTGLALGMDGRDLADLYFARWPIQENAFKDATAIGMDEHRGNCGEMVANVAVVSELERLELRAGKASRQGEQLDAEMPELHERLTAAERDNRRAQAALAVRRQRLDALVAEGRRDGRRLSRVAIDHHAALTRAEATAKDFDIARRAVDDNMARADAVAKQLDAHDATRSKLAPRQRIRKLDVALDSVLTATKLTLALLITFASREYLASMPMTPHTFASRVFGIRGRRETYANEQRIIFFANPRDPELNAALDSACHVLNTRKLTRDGRLLLYETQAPP